jgi:DNA-binding NarL/FixJ family response regulator
MSDTVSTASPAVSDDSRGTDVRAVVVDIRSERRQQMRYLLERSFTRGQIAEADSRTAAIALVDRFHPDLVVLEIQMPLQEGLDTIAALHLVSSPPRIVVCSFHRDAGTVEAALERGADAYLIKPVSFADFGAALGPLPAERIFRHRPPNERPVSPPPPLATLDAQERRSESDGLTP